MKDKNIKLLILEDDKVLSKLLMIKLQNKKFDCKIVKNIQEATVELEKDYYDILILDLLLSNGNGAELLIKLRRNGNEIPIIILSAVKDMSRKIEMLESGADDYIEKPFIFEELVARIETNLRRRRSKDLSFISNSNKNNIKINGVALNFKNRSIKVEDKEEEVLAPREFAILAFLMSKKGEICSREEIWESIEPGLEMPNTNTIDVHLLRIRRKVGNDKIKCIKKRGFSFLEN